MFLRTCRFSLRKKEKLANEEPGWRSDAARCLARRSAGIYHSSSSWLSLLLSLISLVHIWGSEKILAFSLLPVLPSSHSLSPSLSHVGLKSKEGFPLPARLLWSWGKTKSGMAGWDRSHFAGYRPGTHHLIRLQRMENAKHLLVHAYILWLLKQTAWHQCSHPNVSFRYPGEVIRGL